MHSAKFVISLLLAVASLRAVANPLTLAGHRPTTSRHKSTANPKKKKASKRISVTKTKNTKHQEVAHKRPKVAEQRHSPKHQVASRPHHALPAKHHLAKHTASAARRPAKQQLASRTYTVTATVYQAVPGQTDGSPFVTADNSRIKPRYGSHTRWLALSPDLLKQGGGKFDYGDKVRVSSVSPQLDGVYTAHDTMNRRHRRRIDILTHRSEKLHVFAPDAKLRLAEAPRKSRAQATAVTHARPDDVARARAVSFRSRTSGKHANYLASAIL